MPPSTPITAAEKFRLLLQMDRRYDPDVVSPRGRHNQHVTGQELLEGVRRYSIEQFGCLARPVLESWGIRRTDDFGEMVFNLVNQDLMGKQESDSKEDFHEVYDFAEVFDVKPVFSFASDRKEWKASYIARRQQKV
jgi:uncharacterized repeat protein (TIGR04138 family)